jgi:hypothetical protein
MKISGLLGDRISVVFLFFESQFMDQLCHYLRDYHEKTVDY